jgi:hypothetical protein
MDLLTLVGLATRFMELAFNTVVRGLNLKKLMEQVCEQGSEHHAAMARSHCAAIVNETVTAYLGWDMYVHDQAG